MTTNVPNIFDVEEFDEQDAPAETEAEAEIEASEQEQPKEEELPELDRTITFGGRTFVLDEPSAADTLAILAFVAKLSRRASRSLLRELKGLTDNPSGQDVIGMLIQQLAEKPQDLLKLTVLVLFGDSEAIRPDRDAFYATLNVDEHLKFSVLSRALLLRLIQSEDLRDTLGNFGGRLDMSVTERNLRRAQKPRITLSA